MSKTTAQYHPRHQWLNQAAIDYHTELAKPAGARNDELIDSLRSEILVGLNDFFRFLTVSKQTIGTQNTEDIVQNLLVSTMEVTNAKGMPGWLDGFQLSKGVPFLGYLADCAKGGASHTIRDEAPGSGRAQDETRRFRKELAKRREEHPDEDLDTAKTQVFNAMGIGLDQIKNVEVLSKIHIVSTEQPIGEGITLGDTLAHAEDEQISTIDRTTLQLRIDRMPDRYKGVLESMLEGRIEGIHEIKFGKPMTLAEKVVTFSTAMKVARDRASRRNPFESEQE